MFVHTAGTASISGFRGAIKLRGACVISRQKFRASLTKYSMRKQAGKFDRLKGSRSNGVEHDAKTLLQRARYHNIRNFARHFARVIPRTRQSVLGEQNGTLMVSR